MKNYLIVERILQELRLPNQDLPMINIQTIIDRCKDHQVVLEPDTVKRALSLLSLWGQCVYFDEPKELADVVIIDPTFLTQRILADLFCRDPNTRNKRRDGIIRHSDLGWFRFQKKHEKGFESLLPIFVSLLQKLGVLFVTEEDQKRPFLEQRSIILALLPEKPVEIEPEMFKAETPEEKAEIPKATKLRILWPQDPPYRRAIEVERILKFNVLPGELVSRLLVLLHPSITSKRDWSGRAR